MVGALACLAAAAPLLVALAGFTVDDAFIPVAYARSLAEGHGYRFFPGAPVTDGVTPLPFAVLLVPIVAGADDLVAALLRARTLSLGAWLACVAVVGAAVARDLGRRAGRGLVLAAAFLAVAVAPAAYAHAGLETTLAALLVAAAATVRAGGGLVPSLAGLAATLRPELAPAAATLAALRAPHPVGRAARSPRPVGRRIAAGTARAAFALAPFTACALVRAAVFGDPAPLSLRAKPSDLAHGLVYVGALLVVGLAPLAVPGPRTARILARDPEARALAAALGVHAVALVLAGGDAMPYARLGVPAAPLLALFVARLAVRTSPRAVAARAAIVLACGAALAARTVPAGRRVLDDRLALVEAARPRLASARGVAAVDVGWLRAVTAAPLLDLAGVTDPAVAALPGGHTSKRVPVAWLDERGVDVLLVLEAKAPTGPRPVHAVSAALAASPWVAAHFREEAPLPLGAGYRYRVLRRAAP